MGRCDAVLGGFHHLPLIVRAGRHLRQMRNAQHLARVPEASEEFSDDFGDGAADAAVDFVKNEGRNRGDLSRDDGNRQRNAGEFAAGRDLG